jgi:hypothetical protein
MELHNVRVVQLFKRVDLREHVLLVLFDDFVLPDLFHGFLASRTLVNYESHLTEGALMCILSLPVPKLFSIL